MRNINLRYMDETYNDKGQLVGLNVNTPEDFNFAYDCVDDIAVAEPDRPAMVWCNPEGEEHHFTFGDIKYWSDKTANFLMEQGVRKGDLVMVILRRHYQFWFTAVALNKIGAVIVPATFMLKEHDMVYRLKRGQIKTVVCTDVGEIAQVCDNVQPECPGFTTKILVNGGGGGLVMDDPALGSRLSGSEHVCELTTDREGWVDFNSGVRAASERFERVATLAKDPMIMYFSSGTSGEPKMVLHNSGYATGHITTAKHWHNVVSDGGIHFTIADTGWGKAVWGKFYGQWIMEACVFTYDFDRFHAAEILSLIGKYGITTLCCPPTMYRFLALEDVESYDLSSLRYCTTAGEALPPDLFNNWLKRTGLTIYEGFGQTETVLTVGNLTNSTPHSGSMGKPNPEFTIEVKRVDDTTASVGETGEICIAYDKDNPPAGIMMEYYRDPEKTADAIRDGWYHTGDTAWFDEDGYLWYVGRNDDVIKSSGYRIGPFEIESVLLEHDAVLECAVTGVPDPIRGKAVKATIVLAKGFAPSDSLTKELQTWVKHKTAPYKYPRIIDYVDELPKTVNGKVRRGVIRDADERAQKDGLI